MNLRNLIIPSLVAFQCIRAASIQTHYFAHPAVEDQHGVIAPWYKGQNGQYDFRVRVAAETIKRYPWVNGNIAVMAAPEYVYDGSWRIDDDGTITATPQRDFDNGDLAQRATFIIEGMIDYYRYSGDPAAFTAIASEADYLINHCVTEASAPWPKFLISVPTMGVRYGNCRVGQDDDLKNSHGKIQLDIVGEVGYELVRAYEMTGNERWYTAAKHWADLLAENRRHDEWTSPWGRYANNVGEGMNGIQTGGVSLILLLFDELIRTGYTGVNGDIIKARDDGRAYLKNALLPAWTVNDTWGRHFWDWENPTQARNLTWRTVAYLMEHQAYFTNWKTDVRNILTLLLNHTSVNPKSNSDTYSGAWAFPESASCCGRSLSYATMSVASAFAEYAVAADSEWAREIARRSELLATYDGLENGQSMDLIDGGSRVNEIWFKIAQPMALVHVLRTMSYLPEIMGASRENHLFRSSCLVQRIIYGKDHLSYQVFDAPGQSLDILRLAYSPTSIRANGNLLNLRSDLAANGYTVRQLPDGDQIVSIRHDGATEIVITGRDPERIARDEISAYEGSWLTAESRSATADSLRVTSEARAAVVFHFDGNQVRLVAPSSPSGGLADVYLDGIRQLVPIDYYTPISVEQQILYYRNGLAQGPHTLKVVARGSHNPLSKGNEVVVDALEYSAATGENSFGPAGGPTEPQRLIFGYTYRRDYVDSRGNTWRPGAEFIARTGILTDSVAKTWWTTRQAVFVSGTDDPELYRYGVHWKDFTVNLTVGPGSYHVRLKFAETQYDAPRCRLISIWLNALKVIENFDIWSAAGGQNKAVDLNYDNIEPQNGIITIRFVGKPNQEAVIQALEVGPGSADSIVKSKP